MVVLKHGVIVVGDSQVAEGVNLKHIVPRSVVNVVHQTAEHKCRNSNFEEEFLYNRHLQETIARVHNSQSVLEVVIGVSSVVVKLLSFFNKRVEAVPVNIVSGYYICLHKHSPRISIHLLWVLEIQVAYLVPL